MPRGAGTQPKEAGSAKETGSGDFLYTTLEERRPCLRQTSSTSSRSDFDGKLDLPTLSEEPADASPTRRGSKLTTALRGRNNSGFFNFDDLPDNCVIKPEEESEDKSSNDDEPEEDSPIAPITRQEIGLIEASDASDKAKLASNAIPDIGKVHVSEPHKSSNEDEPEEASPTPLITRQEIGLTEASDLSDKAKLASNAIPDIGEVHVSKPLKQEAESSATILLATASVPSEASVTKPSTITPYVSNAAPSAPTRTQSQAPTLSKFQMDEILSHAPEPGLLIPLEAKYWSEQVFQQYVLSGGSVRPKGCSIPDPKTMANTTMTQDEIQEALAEAAQWIATADALLVGSGAGMGVDSGLGTFRGRKAGVWDGLEAVGLDYAEICEPHWFQDEPRLVWGFWNFCYQAYQATEPHTGYSLVDSWARATPLGCFSFTSNIDSHWELSGWEQDRILEVHGAVKWLQCSAACCQDVWEAPADLGLTEDPGTHHVEGTLPICPKCAAVARPAVQMFGKDVAFSRQRRSQQAAKYDSWLTRLAGRSDAKSLRIICLELGCGVTVPTVRTELENVMGRFPNARIIRVNPECPGLDQSISSRGVSLPLGAGAALNLIQERLQEPKEEVVFVLWDEADVGVELVAPRGTKMDELLRLARRLPDVKVSISASASARAGHLLLHKRVKNLRLDECVPSHFISPIPDSCQGAVVLFAGVIFKYNGRQVSNPQLEKRRSQILLDIYNTDTENMKSSYQAALRDATPNERSNLYFETAKALTGMTRENFYEALANIGMVAHGCAEVAKKSARNGDLNYANGQQLAEAALADILRERAAENTKADGPTGEVET